MEIKYLYLASQLNSELFSRNHPVFSVFCLKTRKSKKFILIRLAGSLPQKLQRPRAGLSIFLDKNRNKKSRLANAALQCCSHIPKPSQSSASFLPLI